MSYEPMNKDYILPGKDIRCSDTGRELTSYTAYYVRNIYNGHILQLSKECAIKRLENTKFSIKDFIDLTRGNIISKPTPPIDVFLPGSNPSINAINSSENDEIAKKKALEYLELRENKLKEFGTSYKLLKNYYLQSKREELTKENINHILNIESTVQENENHWMQNLSLVNLQKVYYLKCRLEQLIFNYKNDKYKIDFFSSIMRQLSKKLEISKNQEKCLKSYL